MKTLLMRLLPLMSTWLIATGCSEYRQGPATVDELVGSSGCDRTFDLEVEFAGLVHLDADRMPTSEEFWLYFIDPTNQATKNRVADMPAHSTMMEFDPTQVDVGSLPTQPCLPDLKRCRRLVLDGYELTVDGLPPGRLTADWSPRVDSSTSLHWLLDFDEVVHEVDPQATKDLTPLRRSPYHGDLLKARWRGTTGHLAVRRFWGEGAQPFVYQFVRDEKVSDRLKPRHLARSLGWTSKVRGCATLELVDLTTRFSAGSLRIHGGGDSLVHLSVENAPAPMPGWSDHSLHAHETAGGASAAAEEEEEQRIGHLAAYYSLYGLPANIRMEDLYGIRRAGTVSPGPDAQCSPSTGEKDP